MRMVPSQTDPSAKPIVLKVPSRDWRVVVVLWDRMVREVGPEPTREERR